MPTATRSTRELIERLSELRQDLFDVKQQLEEVPQQSIGFNTLLRRKYRIEEAKSRLLTELLRR